MFVSEVHLGSCSWLLSLSFHVHRLPVVLIHIFSDTLVHVLFWWFNQESLCPIRDLKCSDCESLHILQKHEQILQVFSHFFLKWLSGRSVTADVWSSVTWTFGLDVETLSAACKLKHPSVSQSSGHHRSLHPSIHPSRPAHLRLVCVFPVTEVQAPRWGLVPPGPELPPAHGGGGRSRAGPGSREEPVPDPECARIRHPRSHLTHEGRRESRLRFLSVLRLCWFVCRLCSQRLYWHPCSSSSDSLTVNMFPTNRHHMSLNLKHLVGGTCCGYWLVFTVASSVERQLLWGDGGQFDDREYNTGNPVVV